MIEFCRSPEIDERIDTIRWIPREPSVEKIEAARELRMGIFLEEAKFAEDTINKIQKEPTITEEELIKRLADENVITHPDAAAKFVKQAVDNRNLVLQILDELKEHPEKVVVTKSKKMGVTGLQILSNSEAPTISPTENIQIPGKQEYPLAVTIIANEKLFSILYSAKEHGKKVAGFHSANLFKFHGADVKDKEGITFPLIVVKENKGYEVELHEQGHSINTIFRQAIYKPESEGKTQGLTEEEVHSRGAYLAIWGTLKIIDGKKAFDSAWELANCDEKKKKVVVEARNWALAYALTRAKDELLADYEKYPKHFSIPMRSHLNTIQVDPLYDYFKRDIELRENSEAYIELRERYLEALKTNVDPVIEILSKYGDCEWGSRVDSLRYVLMRIPIEKWAETMKNTLFEKESELAIECKEYENQLKEYLMDMNYSFITINGVEAPAETISHYTTEKDAEKFQEVREEYERLSDKFTDIISKNHKTTPMIGQLQELSEEFSILTVKAGIVYESSDVRQYRTAFQRLLERFPVGLRDNAKRILSKELIRSEKSFYGTLTDFQKRHGYELER